VANIVAVVKRRATEEDRAASMAPIVSRDAEMNIGGVVATGAKIKAGIEATMVVVTIASSAHEAPTGATGRTGVTVAATKNVVQAVTVAATSIVSVPVEVSPAARGMIPAGAKVVRWVIVAKNIVATIRSVEEEGIVRGGEILDPVKATIGGVVLAKKVVAIRAVRGSGAAAVTVETPQAATAVAAATVAA
jgi:hypothetical protein